MPLFVLKDVAPELWAAFQANMSSLVLDQQARLKVGGTHLTYGYLKQLPVLRPSAYKSADLDFIVSRVLELTYTAWDMQPFAKDLGYDGPPFRWDPERRAVLRAELDAYYAYLYALTREELCYILDPKAVKGEDFPSETFRVLKNNEISQHSEYLTQRLVFEAFDRFASDDTFDPARLQDPIYFPVLKKAYAEKSRAYAELQATHRDLLARADQQAKPVLFVEGRSDVPVIEAAWSVFFPGQPMPFAVLAAGGTTQMGSLAGKGKALRDVLGNRLVCALADNDGDGRRLWDNGLFRKGGVWRLHPNGIWWCLLQPRDDFRTVMQRFGVPEASFPFTVEAAFPASFRRQAMAEGAYILSDEPQTDLTQEPAPVKKLFAEIPKLAPDDDARLELLAPDPTCKEAFAAWITAPERRTPEVYAAFEGIIHGLKELMDRHARGELNPPQRPAAE